MIIVRITFVCLLLTSFLPDLFPQALVRQAPERGYSQRISNYVDTIKIVDSHEHLFDPALLRRTPVLNFSLLFMHYNLNDLISAGLKPDLWDDFIGDSLTVMQKWNLIEPYWQRSFNTGYNRISLIAADRLYGIQDINRNTIVPLSDKIKKAYQTDWFRQVINEKCNIESLILDGEEFQVKGVKIYNVRRFTSWITLRSRFTVDSIAIMQLNPIRTLEDFVKSLDAAVRRAVESGIVAIKINIAYSRPLNFEDVRTEAARKVFRMIMDGEVGRRYTFDETRILHDYMVYRLLDMARKYKMPVAFHTGLMAGSRLSIGYSDPTLLTNIFQKYPDIDFILFHGSYPYGGKLATLTKNFNNVYMDLSWIYAISPSYSERYLHEWLEAVPAGKIIAFGGDFSVCENVFGELVIARQTIARVLTQKVSDGYLSEEEAMTVAKMILYENVKRFYNLD